MIALLLAPATAAAQVEVRRRVAVLEYRAGAAGAVDLVERIAEELRATAALDIVDLAEARRRDAGVDGAVGRCAGDPECTAAIGGRLDVDEVLLVAMSQIGDLVLNLQRIDAFTSRVLGAPLSAVLPGGRDVDAGQIDAWLRQLFPPAVFKRYGYLSVLASVNDAVVKLDGEDRGRTPLLGRIKLPAPRSYHLTVTKKGRVAFDLPRIDVVPDATVQINAELPEAQGPAPWYRRWYPWVIAGAVIGGVAIGAAVYITREDPSRSNGVLVIPPH